MLDGFELNSVELNAGAIYPFEGEGDVTANASMSGQSYAIRRPTGEADALAVILATAYPIRPSAGSLLARSSVNAIVANAIRKAQGDSYSYAGASGFLEAVVPASGYAIGTAILTGIPASTLGFGDAETSAVLTSNGNRVRFSLGAAICSASVANSGFDVVRQAYASPLEQAYAIATGEPAVGVKKDASGTALCVATFAGNPHIDSLLAGSALVSAAATGEGDIWFTSKGNLSGTALLWDDAVLLARGDSDAVATSILDDSVVRIANAKGNANAKANYFARAIARRKAKAVVNAKAILQGNATRFSNASVTVNAKAQAQCLNFIVYRYAFSDITATAVSTGRGLANSHDLAPPERTVFIRSQGVRIVDVGQENRTIRVLA